MRWMRSGDETTVIYMYACDVEQHSIVAFITTDW